MILTVAQQFKDSGQDIKTIDYSTIKHPDESIRHFQEWSYVKGQWDKIKKEFDLKCAI